ncbi:hypothetical protein [Arthrobacter sp. UYEF21]|uniref:hypothetical protein n=1 Tax=Arthrobacter sp. UYEF21 TaxID=1756364 RepID=UPI003395A458
MKEILEAIGAPGHVLLFLVVVSAVIKSLLKVVPKATGPIAGSRKAKEQVEKVEVVVTFALSVAVLTAFVVWVLHFTNFPDPLSWLYGGAALVLLFSLLVGYNYTKHVAEKHPDETPAVSIGPERKPPFWFAKRDFKMIPTPPTPPAPATAPTPAAPAGAAAAAPSLDSGAFSGASTQGTNSAAPQT